MYLFQETITSSLIENLGKYQSYILIIVGIFITFVYFKTGLSERMASGWEKLSGLQDKEVKQLEEQIAKDAAKLLELVREVDVRREINRQDSTDIKTLKLEITALEETISRLRAEIRNLNNGV